MSTLDQHDRDLERALRDAFEVATEDAVRTPAPPALLARVSQAAHDDRVRPVWRTWGVGAAAALLAVAAGVAVWPHGAASSGSAPGAVTAESPTAGTTGSGAEPALTLAGYHVSLPPGYTAAAAGECDATADPDEVGTLVVRGPDGECLRFALVPKDRLEFEFPRVQHLERPIPYLAVLGRDTDAQRIVVVLADGTGFEITSQADLDQLVDLLRKGRFEITKN